MEKSINIQKYKIPQDIFMDIMRILFRNKVNYTITGIKEKENSLFLSVDYTALKMASEVQENIEIILEEYCEYMKGIISDSTLRMDADREDEF